MVAASDEAVKRRVGGSSLVPTYTYGVAILYRGSAEHAQAPIAPKRLAEISLLPYDISLELDDWHSRATLW